MLSLVWQAPHLLTCVRKSDRTGIHIPLSCANVASGCYSYCLCSWSGAQKPCCCNQSARAAAWDEVQCMSLLLFSSPHFTSNHGTGLPGGRSAVSPAGLWPQLSMQWCNEQKYDYIWSRLHVQYFTGSYAITFFNRSSAWSSAVIPFSQQFVSPAPQHPESQVRQSTWFNITASPHYHLMWFGSQWSCCQCIDMSRLREKKERHHNTRLTVSSVRLPAILRTNIRPQHF